MCCWCGIMTKKQRGVDGHGGLRLRFISRLHARLRTRLRALKARAASGILSTRFLKRITSPASAPRGGGGVSDCDL